MSFNSASWGRQMFVFLENGSFRDLPQYEAILSAYMSRNDVLIFYHINFVRIEFVFCIPDLLVVICEFCREEF